VDSLATTRIYMIGIGGCGMSGLARLLREQGCTVSGSDSTPSPVTDQLTAEGFSVDFDQSAGKIPDDLDLVVASAAIPSDHPQARDATRRGLSLLRYPEALGLCMQGRTGVAIAGTHGKSTTTAMLGCVLADAGLDPSVIVGATCSQLTRGALSPPTAPPAGFRVGSQAVPAGPLTGRPGLMLAEACEFSRSFHHLRPRIASISAVEADHLDVYGSLDAVVDAFRRFAELLPPADQGGLLIIAHDGAHRREVAAGLPCEVQTIGFSPQADWTVSWDPATGATALSRGLHILTRWTTRLPGAHNAMNAATAAALAVRLGAEPPVVGASLASFQGLERRTQLLGDRLVPGGSVRVYDDYGHHPTEVDATLRALRNRELSPHQAGRLVCVFQPHQHSRTRFLLDEFATAFSSADVVIVPHIYFVRDSEQEKQRVSAADLVDRLRKRNVRAMHLYPFEAIVEQLESICRPGDLLVVMGAGPVWQVAHAYLHPTPTQRKENPTLAVHA